MSASPPAFTRRDALRTGLAGGAILSLPAAVYRGAFAADTPPSERVRLGSIGVGNQGGPKNNLKFFTKLAPIVAVCDVDATRVAAAADFVSKAQSSSPRTFGDYRKLLDEKDVDAVVVTTPDHWHALMTIQACEAGKDVYCEKPLTLVIDEGKAMVAAARRTKRVVQTGSQQRSAREFRLACELVRNGAIGKVGTVKVGLPGPNWSPPPVPNTAPPAELNYDLWLGPAPLRPYNAKRTHYLFRFFWDYSGGQQTNFGAHHLDITQWALGADESGPVKVTGTATFNPNGWFETPETANITYTYADGTLVQCGLGRGAPAGGCTFLGDRGTIYVTRGKIEVTLNGEKVKDPYKLSTGDVKLYVSNNHHQNWLDCIQSRKLPICDVAIGHRSATVCHLGNIAVRTGKPIAWDPAKEVIIGDAATAKWATKEYRAPWKLV